MLTVTIPAAELYDESTSKFIVTRQTELQLEHSLVSLAKWESKWKKSFLSEKSKTAEETLDYIRCMTITQNVDQNVYKAMPGNVIQEINEYIMDPMTATTFAKSTNKPSREIITAEIIYYDMIALNIPIECQKWHLNRLLALIKVCSLKSVPPKKMSKRDLLQRNRSLNAARRSARNTHG